MGEQEQCPECRQAHNCYEEGGWWICAYCRLKFKPKPKVAEPLRWIEGGKARD